MFSLDAVTCGVAFLISIGTSAALLGAYLSKASAYDALRRDTSDLVVRYGDMAGRCSSLDLALTASCNGARDMGERTQARIDALDAYLADIKKLSDRRSDAASLFEGVAIALLGSTAYSAGVNLDAALHTVHRDDADTENRLRRLKEMFGAKYPGITKKLEKRPLET